MKVQEFFAQHPVFTHAEFLEFFLEPGKRSRRTADSLLAYHARAKHLLRVRRGVYACGRTGTAPVGAAVDPYLVAAKATDDAVLAYHTALEFRGKAYSSHRELRFLTHHALRPFSFSDHEFYGLKPPRALFKAHKEHLGVCTEERLGLSVKVTGLERTLVDVLDRPDLAGGWEEVWRSLESVEFFDLDQVIEYALLLKNATTNAKVGFFLEQHRESLMVKDEHLKRLRRHRPRQPHYLERGSGLSRFVSSWNLMIPEKVLKRSWAEVA